MSVRPLFICGAARSGTSALTEYLNLHEELLVCMERYRFVPRKVDPRSFTFERILDYEARRSGGEASVPREYHAELLSRKDPAKLRWIGDKHPGYVVWLQTLLENNPGARFIITHRPIEEVAESHEARSRNPDDPWLGGKDGFEIGIEGWNRAMRSTRGFIEGGSNPNVLLIGYDDFFRRNEECMPLISQFLEIEFDDSVREAWAEMSRKFERGRREKEPLSGEQAKLIEEKKDTAAEEWILERIERHWSEPGLCKRSFGEDSDRRSLAAAFMRQRARSEEQSQIARRLERRLEKARAEMDERGKKPAGLKQKIAARLRKSEAP